MAETRSPVALTSIPCGVLPIICRTLNDRTVFLLLGLVSRHFHAAITCCDEFFRFRESRLAVHVAIVTARAHTAIPLLRCCMLVPGRSGPRSFADLRRPLGPHQISYIRCHGLDISRGTEAWPVTVNPCVTYDDRHFCTALPPAIASSQFEYDAGPVPAAYMLQVFRYGSDGVLGIGYGVRALEPIEKGAFVLLYWGQYSRADHPGPLKYQQYTENAALRTLHQYRLVFCGTVDPLLGIDASKTGNVARWINHSSNHPNVIPRFMEEPPHVGAIALLRRLNRQGLNGKQVRLLSWNESKGRWAVLVERSVIGGPIEKAISILVKPANLFVFASHEPASQIAPSRLPLVAFYAARRIELGEQLLWNYRNDQKSGGIDGLPCSLGPVFTKSAPASGGSFCERLVRHVPTGQLAVGNWSSFDPRPGQKRVETSEAFEVERVCDLEDSGTASDSADADALDSEWDRARLEFPPLDQRPCGEWHRIGMQIEDAHYQHVDTRMKEWWSAGEFEDEDGDSDRVMSASYFEPFPLYC